MSSVVKRVIVAAARCDCFFDQSSDERVGWMVERAYRMGPADSTRRARSRCGEFADRPVARDRADR
jgi:hypothetical protein